LEQGLSKVFPIARSVYTIGFLLFFQWEMAYAWGVNAANCDTYVVPAQQNGLQFGSIMIITSGSPGSITVGTSNNIISSSNVLPVGGTVLSASFLGDDSGNGGPSNPGGCTNRSLVNVVVSDATLTGTGEDMTVTGMTPSIVSGTWDYRTTPLTVGGTLNINANQLSGNYNGTYSITVYYQ